MDLTSIIAQIDEQISRLQQAKTILSGSGVKRPTGRPKATDGTPTAIAAKPAKRVMSAESKAKIAAAQKARWARVRKATRK